MNRSYIIILLGFFVALTPYLGFPQKFKTFLFLVFGLSIAFLAYRVSRAKLHDHENHDVFAENSLFDSFRSSAAEEGKREENLSNIGQ